jgi:hypothetical protein
VAGASTLIFRFIHETVALGLGSAATFGFGVTGRALRDAPRDEAIVIALFGRHGVPDAQHVRLFGFAFSA